MGVATPLLFLDVLSQCNLLIFRCLPADQLFDGYRGILLAIAGPWYALIVADEVPGSGRVGKFLCSTGAVTKERRWFKGIYFPNRICYGIKAARFQAE